MNRGRLAAVTAAAVLILITLTGCPVQAEVDDDEGDDYIHYALTR